MADIFNKYFASVAPNLHDTYPTTSKDTLNYTPNQSAYFRATCTKEVRDIIAVLRSDAAAGYDGLKPHIVKRYKELLAKYIAAILNKYISKGEFPDDLKISQVAPIHKAGHRDEVHNYRPISVLNCFSKIYEKIIYNRLMEYLEKIQYIHTIRMGFEKTETLRLQ